LVVPCLAIVFANQLWAMAHAYPAPRPLYEFRNFNTPLWSYWVPTGKHALARVLGASWYVHAGFATRVGECCSYLGVVALLLRAYAAALRVRFREHGFWWLCLAMVVVLSGGTAWNLDGYTITLPGYWLKRYVGVFQMIRVPARFNLFAAVVAAVVASCGLH